MCVLVKAHKIKTAVPITLQSFNISFHPKHRLLDIHSVLLELYLMIKHSKN